MVAVGSFAAGAMENWGLITYRETALLGNTSVSSTIELQRIAVVVCHGASAHSKEWLTADLKPVSADLCRKYRASTLHYHTCLCEPCIALP
jgi:hypothetical protein